MPESGDRVSVAGTGAADEASDAPKIYPDESGGRELGGQHRDDDLALLVRVESLTVLYNPNSLVTPNPFIDEFVVVQAFADPDAAYFGGSTSFFRSSSACRSAPISAAIFSSPKTTRNTGSNAASDCRKHSPGFQFSGS